MNNNKKKKKREKNQTITKNQEKYPFFKYFKLIINTSINHL